MQYTMFNYSLPVGDHKNGDRDDEDPGLEIIALPEKRHHDRNVSLEGEAHRGVDRSGESHLRDRHQKRGHVDEDML